MVEKLRAQDLLGTKSWTTIVHLRLFCDCAEASIAQPYSTEHVYQIATQFAEQPIEWMTDELARSMGTDSRFYKANLICSLRSIVAYADPEMYGRLKYLYGETKDDFSGHRLE